MKNNARIINFWWAANYGAVLTAFALQQVLKSLEIEPEFVNNSFKEQLLREHRYTFSKKFADKYFHCSPYIKNASDLMSLTEDCNTFITGSDQVFNLKHTLGKSDEFLLDFVPKTAKKIAISASFGLDKETFLKKYSTEIISKFKKSLSSFDVLSVREKSGQIICKDILGLDAKLIVDPVFLAEKENYDELIKNSTTDYTGKIVSYSIFNYENRLPKTYNGKKIISLKTSNVTVENWLAAIKQSEVFITNSFHGVCFALMFQKPFILYSDRNREVYTRFGSLFELLGINDQSIELDEDIDKKDCTFKIDYNDVNKRIAEQKAIGMEFLKEAFNSPIAAKDEKDEVQKSYLIKSIKKYENKSNIKSQIKETVWNIWIHIFHFVLPLFVKNIIRNMRNLINACRK